MYDLRLALCNAFPGLDPIRMLDYPLADVISLARMHLDHTRRARLQQETQRPTPHTSGDNQVKYRPADDSWF